MITRKDIEYIDSKKIKSGEKSLSSVFKDLILWINGKYNFHFFNVIYDKIVPDSRPRLFLITDYPTDEKNFRDSKNINFNFDLQEEIRFRFIDLVSKYGLESEFDTNRLFVCFGEFSKIAKTEAFWNIPNDNLKQFFKEMKDDKIWDIQPVLGDCGLIVFFINQFVEEKVDKHELEIRLNENFMAIISNFDSFDYIKRDGIPVFFSNKEIFEKNLKVNIKNLYR